MIQFEELAEDGLSKYVYCFECRVIGEVPSVCMIESRILRLCKEPGGYSVMTTWNSAMGVQSPIKPTSKITEWATVYYACKLEYIGEQ